MERGREVVGVWSEKEWSPGGLMRTASQLNSFFGERPRTGLRRQRPREVRPRPGRPPQPSGDLPFEPRTCGSAKRSSTRARGDLYRPGLAAMAGVPESAAPPVCQNTLLPILSGRVSIGKLQKPGQASAQRRRRKARENARARHRKGLALARAVCGRAQKGRGRRGQEVQGHPARNNRCQRTRQDITRVHPLFSLWHVFDTRAGLERSTGEVKRQVRRETGYSG